MCCLGICKPDRGRVFFDGEDITGAESAGVPGRYGLPFKTPTTSYLNGL